MKTRETELLKDGGDPELKKLRNLKRKTFQEGISATLAEECRAAQPPNVHNRRRRRHDGCTCTVSPPGYASPCLTRSVALDGHCELPGCLAEIAATPKKFRSQGNGDGLRMPGGGRQSRGGAGQ